MKKHFLKNSMLLFFLSIFRIGIFTPLNKKNNSPLISFWPTKQKSLISLPIVLGILVFSLLSQSMNAQSCEAPANVQIEFDSAMPTAQVTWDGDIPENGWIFLLGMEGSVNIGEFLSDPENYENPEVRIEYVTTNSPHFIYTNMLQEGLYDLYIVADCGDNEMAASEMVNFMMEQRAEENITEDCLTPESMTVFISGMGYVDISWEPQDGELYQIAWGPNGLEMNEDYFSDPQTGSVIISENPYHLVFSGSDPNQDRSYFLRKFCGDNNFSHWAEPICVEPTALESSQDDEDIILTWTPGDTESIWEVAYGLEGFDVNDEDNPDIIRVNAYTTPSLSISVYDLELDVAYDFYVRSKCSEDYYSDWTGPGSFIAEIAECYSPTNTQSVHHTYKSADISWTPGGGETSWTVTYGVSPLDMGLAISVQVEEDPEYTITDLDPETEYDVYVTAICMAGQTADGEIISFSTVVGSTGGYCTPIFTRGCGFSSVIDHFISIGENDTQIYDLNTGCVDSNYDDRTRLSVDFAPGFDYSARVSAAVEYANISGETIVIWIDFDNDGVFQESERVARTEMNSTTEELVFSIPENSSVGERRMRVMMAMAGTHSQLTPCNDEVVPKPNGEVHDYTVNILELESCSTTLAGTPIENFEICPDEAFTVSVSGASSPAEGIERTWQSSPTGQNNWTDIESSILPSLTIYDGISQAKDYRYKVTCTFSGNTDISDFIKVSISTNCYCKPTAQCGGPGGLQINNVTLLGETIGLDSNSGGGGTCYNDYTFKFAPDLKQGENYTLSVFARNANLDNDRMIAWIDYNDNKAFEPGELIMNFTEGFSDYNVLSEFTVPADVPPGNYRMRVRIGQGSYGAPPVEACNNLNKGETEDYLVTVTGVVGVDDNTTANFTYYPNPVEEVLTIVGNKDIESFSAYNLLGQKVLNNNHYNDGKVDVSSLTAGTFIFRVTFNNGQVENFKVVRK